MTKGYKEIIGNMETYSKELHKLIPDTIAGFTNMAKSATWFTAQYSTSCASCHRLSYR